MCACVVCASVSALEFAFKTNISSGCTFFSSSIMSFIFLVASTAALLFGFVIVTSETPTTLFCGFTPLTIILIFKNITLFVSSSLTSTSCVSSRDASIVFVANTFLINVIAAFTAAFVTSAFKSVIFTDDSAFSIMSLLMGLSLSSGFLLYFSLVLRRSISNSAVFNANLL